MRRSSRSAGVLGGLVAVVLLATGCGDEAGGTATDQDTPSSSAAESPSGADEPTGGASPSPSDTTKTEPTCESVWIADAILPRSYRGCFNGERWVRAQPIYCSFGGRMVTYDNRFWAAPGHAISLAEPDLRNDADFQSAFASCTA